MVARRVGTLLVSMFAALVLMAMPALAHDCFNPKKPAGAGVNYTITGFQNGEPVLQQTGPGKGLGGFATIGGTDYHILGPNGGPGVAGSPDQGSEDRLCDDVGLDYASAC